MTDLRELEQDLARLGPLYTFPWHTQQLLALRAQTDLIVVLGGNQSGKTTVGAGIVSRLVRREGPIYQRLRRAQKRGLKIWVSPQLFEKYQSNWEPRIKDEIFAGMEVDYKQTPTPVWTWRDSVSDRNELWGKSQDQGFLAFESDEVDLVLFDEEPEDKRLYTSALQRLAATNGCIVLTFTPLLGLSWTHSAFYMPTCKPEHRIADRAWRRGGITVIQMGMADNPASVEGGGVRRLKENPAITDAERNTRLYGQYGYTEGLIFPQFADLSSLLEESPYLLDRLPDDRTYSWVLTCDPNKRHGGLLTAIDHEGNRIYVAEHYASGLPDRVHAQRYRDNLLIPRGLWDVERKTPTPNLTIAADPGGAGSQAIVNLADHGIYAQPVTKDPGSVKASIELMRRAAWVDPLHPHPTKKRPDGSRVLGAPHVYFLRSLLSTWSEDGVEYAESRLMYELRRYRQKADAPPDTPVKEQDDVVDCARYVELVRPFTPVHREPEPDDGVVLDRLEQRAQDDFQRVSDRAAQPARTKYVGWL